MIDRRYFIYFDWISFGLILLLSAIGLAFVFSATYQPSFSPENTPYSLFFKKQLIGVGSGIALYILSSAIDYRSFVRWGYFLYFATVGLLLFTLIKGSIGMGAQRWINLGIVKFQPSEITKLLFPAFLTHYFLTENKRVYSFSTFTPLLGFLSISSFLVLKQPDLGTAIIIGISGLILLWLAGLSRKFFLYLFLFSGLMTPIFYTFLKPYQKKRIAVFLGQGEKFNERYQIEQSKIAVGSGGLTGKGFLKGTQNQLMFLPESRTDFIFSVLCEEWGFIGALFFLLLYLLLFIRQFLLITSYADQYIKLLAIGLILPIILSMLINIGMVLDLLPIVGIPLPLMSYGITNLWITYTSLGFFNSIAIRRFSHSK